MATKTLVEQKQDLSRQIVNILKQENFYLNDTNYVMNANEVSRAISYYSTFSLNKLKDEKKKREANLETVINEYNSRKRIENFWNSERGIQEKNAINKLRNEMYERSEANKKFITQTLHEIIQTLGYNSWKVGNASDMNIKIQYFDKCIPSFIYGFEITFDYFETSNEYSIKMLSNPLIKYNSDCETNTLTDMILLYASFIKHIKSNDSFNNVMAKYINEWRELCAIAVSLTERSKNPKI